MFASWMAPGWLSKSATSWLLVSRTADRHASSSSLGGGVRALMSAASLFTTNATIQLLITWAATSLSLRMRGVVSVWVKAMRT
ncbi:hypothetical protein BJY52DRAFT_1270889 [Lactarius psammicola]|nr:hypothetical protein BJY52DRAFT_1270889 [Lactarius psammicola]